jgi:hypothetical protein
MGVTAALKDAVCEKKSKGSSWSSSSMVLVAVPGAVECTWGGAAGVGGAARCWTWGAAEVGRAALDLLVEAEGI